MSLNIDINQWVSLCAYTIFSFYYIKNKKRDYYFVISFGMVVRKFWAIYACNLQT